MALDQRAVISRDRALIAALPSVKRCFAPSENDEHKLPDALNEFPAVLVLPGPTLEYILGAGTHRHTYEEKVLVFCNQGGDLGESAYQAMPIVDEVIAMFAGNVTRAGLVNAAVFARCSGLVALEFNATEYLGWEITNRVSEQASVTPAVGSAP